MGTFLGKAPADQHAELQLLVGEATATGSEDASRSAVWKIALLSGISDPAKEQIVNAGHLEVLPPLYDGIHVCYISIVAIDVTSVALTPSNPLAGTLITL